MRMSLLHVRFCMALILSLASSLCLCAQIVERTGSYGAVTVQEAETLLGEELLHNSKLLLQQVLADYPASPAADEARYLLAIGQIRNGDIDDAQASLQDLAIDRPNSPLVPFALAKHAELAFEQGRYDRAYELFDRAALRAEEDYQQRSDTSYRAIASAGLFWSGISQAKGGDDRKARAPLQACADRYPDYAFADDALFILGQFAERRREHKEAIAIYHRISENYPRRNVRVAAQIRAAQNYITLRQPTLALAELESAATANQAIDEQDPEQFGTPGAWERQSYAEEAPAQALYLRGEAHNLGQRYGLAQQSFEQVLDSYPSRRLRQRAELGAAWALLNQGENQRALVYYNKLLASEEIESTLLASARLYRTMALKRNGERDQARKELQGLTLRSDFPHIGLALLELGQIHYEDGEMDLARRVLERAVPEAPDGVAAVRIHLLLGAAALDAGYFSTAAQAYDKVVEIASAGDERAMPNRALYLADARFKRGIALVGASDGSGDAEAQRAVTKLNEFLAEHPGDQRIPEARFWLAEAYYKARLMANAKDAYQFIIRNFPASNRREEALYGLGWAQFRTRQFTESSRSFARLMREFPDSRFALDVLTREGDAHYLNRNYRAAADAYRQVVRRAPRAEQGEYCLYQLAQALRRMKKFSEAIAELRHLFTRFPRSSLAADSRYTIGWMLFEQHRYDEAIEEMQRLMKDYSGSNLVPRAHHAIADAHYNSGRYETALSVYTEIVEYYPNSPFIGEALNSMEYCLEFLGRSEEAAQVRIMYLSLNPDSRYREEELFSPERGFWETGSSDAVNEYRKFIDDNPQSERLPEAIYYLGKSHASLGRSEDDLTQYQRALEAFVRVVRDYPDHPFAAKASIDLGMTAKLMNEPVKADSLWEITKAKYAGTSEGIQAGFEQAVLRMSRGDTIAALEAFRHVADSYRGSFYGDRSRFRLAVYYVRRTLYDSARAELKTVAERDDDLGAEAQFNIARSYYWEKAFEDAKREALVCKNRFPEYEPFRTEALLILGWCYEKLDEIPKALETFRLVAALGEDDEYANTARANLERIEKAQGNQ